MSKQSNNIKVSVADIIQLFQTAPEQAYEQLISSSHYFHTKQTKSFWVAYSQLDFEKLNLSFPESTDTFNKVVWLKLFYDLSEFYKTEKTKCLNQLAEFNPSAIDLIKSLFLCLELGETNSKPSNFPSYSAESAEAIKILLKEIYPLLKSINQSSYSGDLTQLSNSLIKIQLDIALLDDFLDAFVWGGFDMTQKEEDKGFLLRIAVGNAKSDNLFVLNQLKTFVKRDFKKNESHSKISLEEHFKLNDPKWKTQEGLSTIIHSSGVKITSQTSGTTSLQVENTLLTDITSEDPNKKEEAIIKIMLQSQEQNFHYQYRQALSQIYQPNDEIDIHALHLEVDHNVYISLYDLLCAMSCLIAKADSLRYISDFQNGSIKSFKNNAKLLLKKNKPLRTEEEINLSVDTYFVTSLPEIEQRYDVKAFNFFEHDSIINWFKQIEELNKRTTQEFESILKLFSGFDSSLPFNPLYKVGEQFYFSYASCNKFDLNRILYDKYISEKLFSLNKKPIEEQREISDRNNKREGNFARSTSELFKTLTAFTVSNFKFGGSENNWEFGELEGDIDTLVYFEKENILLSIQIKLSNVSPKNEKRKEEWIRTRIVESGLKQVAKDFKLLKTELGLNLARKKLGLNEAKKIVNPTIYPLIVTDNFFADHCSFVYNETGDKVFCVSYFELKHLIINQKVNDKQKDWLIDVKDNPASQLIKSIETNSFWDFLNEFVDGFHFHKKLSTINDELKIDMTV